MRQRKIFLILALLCAVVQGAKAQANWEEVYAMTGTSAEKWTQLNAGSTTGQTLGAAGTTTYYYADTDLTFTNSNTGGSGLTILGTVYLYVPDGVTLTCTGANASGQTGAGAGIEVAAGNALYLLGKGTVNATGGNAANGGDGTNGGDANWDSSNYWSGTGGTGGHGGGGAGAGIGTRGGNGGAGGSGAANKTSAWSTDFGGNGSKGKTGATAGAMGALCVSTSFTNLTATGGAAASQGGSAGSAGKGYLYDGSSNNYSAAGGGGGGGGGFGGAATGIGTGGPGGGGGGGGASSNLDYAASGYYVVKAPGGKGGQNADGTWAAAGAEGIMNHNAFKNGQVITNGSGWDDDAYNYDSYVSTQGVGIGGSGSAAGNASTSESAISITTNTAPPTQEEWDVVCRQTNTSQSQWTALPFGTSTGTTLGTAGATTYYYAPGDRTFINANAGGSGLTILGTVYLFVASGQTITCKGANAGGQTGAGAGIELTAGNYLFLLGQGNVNATGGNAAGGGNGTNGTDAGWDSKNYWSGTGGTGGHGGGGAGAGIGTRGGQGGQGGSGAASVVSAYSTADGGSGSSGQAGATASAMGNLYVAQSSFHITATGGAAASRGGSAGSAGKSILDDDTSNNYGAAGGGGGGGGGFGGAATGIGTGGPGGGGGGGGASGNLDWAGTGYWVVKAPGGKGGQNADGTYAVEGAESILNYNAINNGQVYSNSSGWSNYDNSVSSKVVGTEGSGGAAGSASTSESAINVNMKIPSQSEWDMVCLQTGTNQSQWTLLPLGGRTGTTIGTAGTTTYYFTTGDRSFVNANAGGSGLTIQGTVYLFILSGQTITCQGANASGTLGAGAGIELAVGNTLYLIGGGKLVATGGNAANGAGGSNGADASFDDGGWSGGGGRGGDGGGGAGAGIGTRGGTGGTGGAGGARMQGDNKPGNVGSNGADGGTAADMGSLYIYPNSSLTTEIHGGSGGTTGGSGGTEGLHALKTTKIFAGYHVIRVIGTTTMGSGAGGAGGGFGGAASDIGTGGPGGGGGGGGASGSICMDENAEQSFYQVGAKGGHPGTNADGTLADAGEDSQINSDQSNVVFYNGTTTYYNNEGWAGGQDNRAAGGSGGGVGATISGSAITVEGVWPTQGDGTEEAPFNISSTDDWNSFASCVSSGFAFSGKYVKLTKDISVTTVAGTRMSDSDNKPFSGTFLGDRHTLTLTITDNTNSGTAPFRSINGATIKNLKVAGTITSNKRHLSGLVGFANGTNLIEGCAVTATLNINTDYAGGIIGHGLDSKTTVSGCVFAGTMNVVGSNNPNVGTIWGWSNNATPTLENCLEAGTYAGIHKMHPMGLQKAAGTITNCYYVTPQMGAPENVCTLSGAKQAYAYTTIPDNLGTPLQDYGMVKAYGNGILYGETYYVAPASISLADNDDNSTTINAANGYVSNVTLQDRTLYKDGSWNTLCLPFNVNSFAGTPLEGATVKTLASTTFSDGTLTMNFTEDVTAIEAGKPYIVKWTAGAENIVNPVFDNVTISNVTANVETDYADFVGTYSPASIYTAGKTNLYLGAGNKLYYPTAEDFKVNAFRGYFQLKQGLTAGSAGALARITTFNLNFGDDNSTGIITTNSTLSDHEWYTIDGRKLDGRPTQRGIYINNGRKVAIK